MPRRDSLMRMGEGSPSTDNVPSTGALAAERSAINRPMGACNTTWMTSWLANKGVTL
jgi:hypothetical protein